MSITQKVREIAGAVGSIPATFKQELNDRRLLKFSFGYDVLNNNLDDILKVGNTLKKARDEVQSSYGGVEVGIYMMHGNHSFGSESFMYWCNIHGSDESAAIAAFSKFISAAGEPDNVLNSTRTLANDVLQFYGKRASNGGTIYSPVADLKL